ncbi:MAG: DUF1772 domain-containing protein [Terracidiphilus sp.]|jgi:uncharacterized membrane protein
MHFFDVITILCTGLMTGNELAVSLFIHPTLRHLDDRGRARAVSLFARSLGKGMPVWYIVSLALITAEAFLRRHEPAFPLLVVAAAIWLAIILITVVVLVPINNRIAALDPSALSVNWLNDHRRWETLHRWRIAWLFAATACLTYAIVGFK